MQIQSVNFKNNYFRPNFSGWYRVAKNNNNEMLYRNDTIWFRFGINEVVDTIVKHFRQDKHVNTYMYGCSNGSEPTSVYLYMLSRYGKDTVSKFAPFNAMDIDSLAIEKARSGNTPMEFFEFQRVLEYTDGKFGKFFKSSKADSIKKYTNGELSPTKKFSDGSTERGICFQLKDEHTKNIKYSVNNILNDYKNINPNEPSLVFARNFMPYLSRYDIHKLLSGLNSQMKEGSLLVLGDYDFCAMDKEEDFSKFLKNELRHNGFKSIDPLGYVYMKNYLQDNPS